MQQALQKGSGGQNDGPASVGYLQASLHPADLVAIHDESRRLSLFQVEVWLTFANPFEPELIRLLVALNARGPDRRPFLGI